MSYTIQLRRDLAANWTTKNSILASGELGLETDTLKAKIGDGQTAWNSLAYWSTGGGGGGAVNSVFGRTGTVVASSGDYSVGQVTGAAPLASPALTGTPTAPTATALTNSTQLSTTAYTDSAVAVEKARALASEALLTLGVYNVRNPTYGATGNGSTDDTAAINAALLACHNAGGGTVIVPPGTYLISAALVIYSNTLLSCAKDAVITEAANANCNMIANFACTANRSVADAAITTGTATLTSNTAAFVSGDVGSTVAVAGANQAGQVLTANILSVTNGTTVVLDTNAQNTVTAAACSIYRRDSNIEITGGVWNRNNNGYTAGGAPNQNTTQLRFIDGLYVHDMSLSAGTVNGYQVSLAAVTNFIVRNITVFAPSTTPNTDGVSVVGPASRGIIDTVFGSDGDDLIALHTNANQGTNSAQCVGNIFDILVTNIFPNGIGQGAVKINSSTGQTANAITVRTVHGTYTGAISFASQQSNITDILFEDIDVISPAASGVNLCYINCPNATGGTLTFKNVALRSYAFSTAINMFQVAAGSNLGSLVLENLTWEAGTTNNGSNVLQLLATVGSPTTINNIIIAKVTGQNTAAAWSNLVLAQQYSTIGTLTMRDVSAWTTQAGNFPLFNAQGAVSAVILDGIYLNGGGELVDTASTASAMQIMATNIVSYAAHRLFKVSSTAQCDIMLTRANVNTLNQAGIINVGSTSALISVRGSDLLNPSNVALFNGSTPTTPARVVHLDARVDVATIAANLGDRAWNTNAASAILGPVIYDGAVWQPAYGATKPWQFLPETYGAKGDGQQALVTTVNGSAVINTTPLGAPAAPTLSNAGSGGALTAGTYQVEVTYVNRWGETVASSSTSQAITGTQPLTISSPTPTGNATGWYAYVTQAGAGTYYRQQAAGSPTALQVSLVLTANPTTTGANPPGSDTTAARVFNAATDVGKNIMICGAQGSPGGPCIDTIASVQSATQATITTAGNITASVSGCPMVFSTDDRAAIDACVTAATAYALANDYLCEIIFGAKIYGLGANMFQSTMNTAGSNPTGIGYNTQIRIPAGNVSNQTQKLEFRMTGPGDNSHARMWTSQYVNLNGCVFVSYSVGPNNSGDATYGQQSVIGGPQSGTGSNGSNGFANVNAVIRGVAVIQPGWSNSIGIDLQWIGGCVIRGRSGVFAPGFAGTGVVNPCSGWTSQSFWQNNKIGTAIRMPNEMNNAEVIIESFDVEGLNVGISTQADHLTIQRLVSDSMFDVIKFTNADTNAHDISIYEWSFSGTQGNALHVGGVASNAHISVDIRMDGENSGIGFDINDAQSNLYGRIAWSDPFRTAGGLANIITPVVSGAANVEIINVQIPRAVYDAHAYTYTLGTAFQNPWWKHATLTITGGDVSGISVGPTSGSMTALGVNAGTFRLPSGWWINIAGSVKPTTLLAVLD